MKQLLFLFAIISSICINGCTSKDKPTGKIFWDENSDPATIGKMITEELFTRSDFMMYELEHATSVHYAEACVAYGATKLAGLLNDSYALRRLSNRYIKVLDDNITNTANHVDANVYGILPLELYMQTGNKRFFTQGIELADGQWYDPLPNGMTNQTRYWIDDVYMIASLQVQAYRATGNEVYLERAALAAGHYLQKLQQPNGLFHHGDGAPFFWGRGNGWVAAGIAELLSELPETNPHYDIISNGYRKMMDALLNHQSDNGMWRQLIDVEESWAETSSTAMFGFAMHMGVKNGLLTDTAFSKAYKKAWLALSKYINEQGQITEVCIGTGKSDDINYYLKRPRITGDFHGQAPMLWFAYSLLKEINDPK